jgi:hypothetical protein
MNLPAEVQHFSTTFFDVTLSKTQEQEILDGSHG